MRIFTLSTNPPNCHIDDSLFTLTSPTPTLFDQVADQLAKEISEPEFLTEKWNKKTRRNEWQIERNRDANKSTQLRKFYDELTMWVDKTGNEEALSKNLPFIRMMNAKVAYANGRKHVDDKFREWFSTCMRAIPSADKSSLTTLRNFKTLFEAFLGFYKIYRPK